MRYPHSPPSVANNSGAARLVGLLMLSDVTLLLGLMTGLRIVLAV